MTKPPAKRRETAWLSTRQFADALDVSVDYLRSELIRRLPRCLVRRDGGRIEIYARGAIEHLFGDLADDEQFPSDDPRLAALLAEIAAEEGST